MNNEYTQDELYEAISDFIDSCHRTDNHDMEDNMQYFLKENDHMEVEENKVRELFEKIDGE